MIAYIEDRLPVTPLAVAQARHALAVNLLPELPEEVLEKVLLLTSEAVSRALAATDQPWRLRVDAEEDVLRVSVRYRPRPGVAVEPDGELRDVIFDSLSDAWGSIVDVDDGTACIWFELA